MICTKENRLSYTTKAKEIVAQMTLDEKIYLMAGRRNLPVLILDSIFKWYNHVPYPAGGNKRLGVPELMFCDGPRGVVSYNSTCFPVTMARGASFDSELEERVGEVIGKEVRAAGGNFYGGVCLNLPYNPGWGRSQEVYGEDTTHMGKMGSALVRGVQHHNVIACLKHYAFNSMELARFKVSVSADKRTEREVYLPHFKKCIEAGAAAVMSAYNRYQGEYCGHNHYLLTEVLKTEWGFDGFVVSDFISGVRDTAGGINGGLDVEMCNTNHYAVRKVKKALQSEKIREEAITESAMRIVRTLLAFTQAKDSLPYERSQLACKEHVALARESAEKSITLLKNQNHQLPYHPAEVKTIALVGDLADIANTGDHGSSWVRPPYVVTLKQGVEKLYPQVKAVHVATRAVAAQKDLIASADRVVVACGCTHGDEGEYLSSFAKVGGDRLDLGLKAVEIAMIEAASAANKNTTVILFGGNMIRVSEWVEKVQALIMAYYPGMEGGNVLADILFGKVNPSGKLPYVVTKKDQDLPQVDWQAQEQVYGYYHGYQKTDKENIPVDFPYGFGLSYTTFSIKSVVLSALDGDLAQFTVVLANTGATAGGEVVQLYVGYPGSKVDRPVKALKDFAKVYLGAGEQKAVTLAVAKADLAFYNAANGEWTTEDLQYTAYIGTDANNASLNPIAFQYP